MTTPRRTLLRAPCGFCRAGLHGACPRAVWSPGSDRGVGAVLWCPCERADHAPVPACRVCGDRHADLGRGLLCADAAACLLRVRERAESNPLTVQLAACRAEARERERAARAERTTQTTVDTTVAVSPVPVREPRRARPPRAARTCPCCGEATRGGLFLPGHDGRFVSQLVARVTAGSLEVDAALDALADSPGLRTKLTQRLAAVTGP